MALYRDIICCFHSIKIIFGAVFFFLTRTRKRNVLVFCLILRIASSEFGFKYKYRKNHKLAKATHRTGYIKFDT